MASQPSDLSVANSSAVRGRIAWACPPSMPDYWLTDPFLCGHPQLLEVPDCNGYVLPARWHFQPFFLPSAFTFFAQTLCQQKTILLHNLVLHLGTSYYLYFKFHFCFLLEGMVYISFLEKSTHLPLILSMMWNVKFACSTTDWKGGCLYMFSFMKISK